MWRRLCIDVDDDGTVIGGSVEFYSDRDLHQDSVLVMEPGWADGRTVIDAALSLEVDGWLQPPLRLLRSE